MSVSHKSPQPALYTVHMVTRMLIWLFFISLWFSVSAQQPFTGTQNTKAERLFVEALKSSNLGDYRKAFDNLRLAIKQDSNFIDAHMLLADLREQNDQFEEAIAIYHKVIRINPDFQIPYYKLSVSDLKAGRYNDALLNINLYVAKGGTSIDKEKVNRVVKNATYGSEAVKHPVPYNPINLGPTINSANNEYFPGITVDDQTLLFTRLESGRNEEFYISHKEKESWSTSRNLGPPVNTENNEGTVSLSSDGQYIFYTACNRKDGEGSCDIFFSFLDGDEWKDPRSLGFPINSMSWESQPTLSFDGRTLYFSSSRPGGYGESDIWYSTYNKGRWSPPVNLGNEINTPGSEQSPFIAKDDKTLYFISDYHQGMGGMDLFISRKQPDGRWGKPKNLGFPINTQADEMCLALSANAEDAFIACDRKDGYGGLDIYAFKLYDSIRPHKTGYIKGYVYDARALTRLKAKLELIDLETGKTIIEASSNKTTGEFLFCLQGNRNYALNVSRDGYLFYSENFALKNQSATEPLVLNVPLNQIQVGEKMVLRNVFYDVDQFSLRPESKIELDKLISFLKANGNVKIEVSGHTDNSGVRQKNTDLSNNRAKTVYQYLINGGIPAIRLTFKGYADLQPIADNKTAEGRQKNRRTEVRITSR